MLILFICQIKIPTLMNKTVNYYFANVQDTMFKTQMVINQLANGTVQVWSSVNFLLHTQTYGL